MPPKGGAAQRLAARQQVEDGPPDPPGASSATRGPPRGGMRQRVVGHKRKLEESDPGTTEEVENQKAYRNHLAQLYLKNQMSAKSAKVQLQLAQKAGAKGAEDLAQECMARNAQRSLMRALCRGNPMPGLYQAEVPCHHPGSATDGVKQNMFFLLPHELLHSFVKADPGKLEAMASLPEGPINDLKKSLCSSLQLPPTTTVPLGCFGDGVPHQRTKSVDTFTWNILSQGSQGDRFLFTAIPKEFECKCGCSGRHTVDAILSIFAWSIKHLILGKFPETRHDGTAWGPEDTQRKAMEKVSLGFHGALMQARGDWSYYKQVFGFPSWASKQICWKCLAGTETHPWTDFGPGASWRLARCTPGQFFKRQRDNGIEPSPLFSIPGFSLNMVVIDVLHCMDLGCTQDMLGNVLWEGLSLYPGTSRAKKLKSLWAAMKAHYKSMKTPVQLQNITEEMIKREKKSPKLKAKGAETRHLVFFGLEVAQLLHQKDHTIHSNTVLKAMTNLAEVYILFGLPEWDGDAAALAFRSFCELYGALYREASRQGSVCWKPKPKFHMAQELLEFQQVQMGNPSSFWNYRDEDSMRLVAELAHQRGGKTSATRTSELVLQKYRALLSQC